uniref:Transcriptional activator protein n=1 Tax=Tomato leaf curl Vietnam virus TaxID=208177 RepID=C9EK59_9GEMI|nr:AC2 protein [Tomato leaf curl Vietnam virus]
MRSSSPSKAHSTQVPIKVQHRTAKKATRRRKVDLPCGCSYFIALGCANHGFSHRGTTHCNSGREWRINLDGQKSPIFQDNQHDERPFFDEQRHHHNTSPIQLQPEGKRWDTPMCSNLPDLDSFTSSDLRFLKSI